jgi:dihydrofolate reductase
MIRLIAAVTHDGTIGIDNKLPFNCPEDMKHFRKSTADSVVIMGRKTFESMGSKPLPKRRNIILSSSLSSGEGYEVYSSVMEALAETASETRDIWVIGGAGVYQETMPFATEILLSLIPNSLVNPIETIEINESSVVTKFPWINPSLFNCASIEPLNPGSEVMLATYKSNWDITKTDVVF